MRAFCGCFVETCSNVYYFWGMTKSIEIRDAHEHNLRHVNLSIPRDSIVVVTGVSGSGKSSLAFDTVFQEGQRRFVESLSAYARQFIGRMKHPEVESVRGISPTISIDQKTVGRMSLFPSLRSIASFSFFRIYMVTTLRLRKIKECLFY